MQCQDTEDESEFQRTCPSSQNDGGTGMRVWRVISADTRGQSRRIPSKRAQGEGRQSTHARLAPPGRSDPYETEL